MTTPIRLRCSYEMPFDSFKLLDEEESDHDWASIAKMIKCPMPENGTEGLSEREISYLAIDHIKKLDDHIGCIQRDFQDLLDQELANIDVTGFSQDDIINIQNKIKFFDIFNIWSIIITLLKTKRLPVTNPKLDQSNFCDYKYLKSKFNEWLTENTTPLSCLSSLSFFNINLRYVPSSICNFENLQILNLSYNHIIALPRKFSLLKNLKELSLKCNELAIVPKCLFDLPKLLKLFLAENPLYRPEESLKRLNAKNIEVDLIENAEKQKEFDKETKKLVLLTLPWMGVLLGVIYVLQNQKFNEEI
ncbi:MAG: hypothetical protein KR126chlam4_00638 [Candidatus Anoxychlamydiales bacterium]|uniref:Uncharacterized protein n=1 Tax=marine sediment metagenome TaxID=412755 RepID=A0A0F9GI13_9ZZZZ|nr:hypothetical protein [Candidatus Anoxychlamydiales bacterium]NGX40807.1 hypothetical protein [Candidatus Anoxychlamydiales bacterium]HEU64163.1 leucine-rich repeat domain-containing protein [Chlamydiota bacterium]